MDNTFSKYGQAFQLTTLSLFLKNKAFTNQIKDILSPEYFDNKYTKWICERSLEYLEKYKSFSSEEKIFEDIKVIIDDKIPEANKKLYLSYLKSIKETDLSNRNFVEEEAQNFCFSKHALLKCKEQENNILAGNFEKAKEIAFSTYKPLSSQCEEMSLKEGFRQLISEEQIHNPVGTPISIFNKYMKGGPGAADLVIVCGQSSLGKCFARGTKIRMYDSSIKNIEELKVGDKVMGWDSSSRTIQSLASGKEMMYKVKQKHGDDYIVNKSHILCLKPIGNYQKYYPNNTSDLVTLTVEEYLEKSKTWRKGHRGFSSSIEYASRKVSLDPYFLGLWLGDGISENQEICGIDEEIKTFLDNYSKSLDMLLTEKEDKNKVKYWTVSRKGEPKGKENYIRSQLKEYNLKNNKHIPDDYLYNTREVRLQLLAGLLDSDGSLEKNSKSCFEITQKREVLARQIYLLARSLGFQVKYTKSMSTLNGKDCGFVYTCYISRGLDKIPTKINRKKAKDYCSSYSTYTQIEVEQLGVDTYYGFTLLDTDKDRMFVLEDYTVVHNTAFLTATARQAAIDGKNVLYFSLETKLTQIASRAVAGLIGINQEDLKEHVTLGNKKIDELKGDIQFVRYPATKALTSTIKQKVDELKAQGFFPDLLIVDGLNQLKLPPGKRVVSDNEKFEYLAEELRDLGSELLCPVYAAFQSNRGGFNVEYADEQNIGKAIEVYQVCDIMVMLTQSLPMLEKGECFAQLLKNRLGKKGVTVRCSYDPNHGTFKEIEEVQRTSLLSNKEKTETLNTLEKTMEKIERLKHN